MTRFRSRLEILERRDAAKKVPPFTGLLKTFWPAMIDLWILGVVFAFFLIRVLGSSLGRHVLARITSGHFR